MTAIVIFLWQITDLIIFLSLQIYSFFTNIQLSYKYTVVLQQRMWMNKIKFKWGRITAVEKSYLIWDTVIYIEYFSYFWLPWPGVPIAQWLQRWYVKPETLGLIPSWGSQTATAVIRIHLNLILLFFHLMYFRNKEIITWLPYIILRTFILN